MANIKILIVDAEQYFHIIYKSMLVDNKYEIISAYDWSEAKKKLEQENPDLIITDIQLDKIIGDTFFLYLKETLEYAEVPVIIISAFPQKDFKGLKEIDPDFVYIDKYDLTEEKLLKEVDKKLR